MYNRLGNEKSPYLLQHKENPVDWYPWGAEAFEKARTEDKPIFLSIGYSTCHWCHVMERESFEDFEVARILNEHYVSIKVDREERPDIDHIYMTVCQALTGQGGWPLTIVMTPGSKPFFAGTYFPKNTKLGKMGLLQILEQIGQRWDSDREALLEAGENISEAVSHHFAGFRGELEKGLAEKVYVFLKKSYDVEYGGFGTAPKFPAPHQLMFLLRYWKRTKQKEALQMVEKTLKSMVAGGIYDHIGFGFSRYSTDRRWLVPHFEKMLYDNALISIVLIEMYQVTGEKFYLRTADEVYQYVSRDMTSPEGFFYSAEDADSEGVEGKFYVWEPEEIEQILGSEDGKYFCAHYDIVPGGNFEGFSIPNRISTGKTEEKPMRLEACRKKLFAHRKKRVHPHKDDKALTAWNGLMVASLAKAAGVSGNNDYLQAAIQAVDFIWQHLRREDGRLLARYRDGEAAYLGYLDDYAFLQWGLLELYHTTLDPEYLSRSLQLLDSMKQLFWDEKNGGFFFYGKDAEELIARPKEVYDGAMPSGNSVAAHNLLRLARITGRDDLFEFYQQQLKAFSGTVSEYPAGYTFFMAAFLGGIASSREIVISGKQENPDAKAMLEAVQRSFLPDTVLIFRPDTQKAAEIELLSAPARERIPVDGLPVAYICENFVCQQPITTVETLMAKVKEM